MPTVVAFCQLSLTNINVKSRDDAKTLATFLDL